MHRRAGRAEAAKWIALYKEIREVIQLGDQYRLLSPQAGPYSAVQYVSKDKTQGVLFAFRTHIPEPAQLPIIYLRGLDPTAIYEIDGIPGRRSGLGWMRAGVYIPLRDLESTVRKIRKV